MFNIRKFIQKFLKIKETVKDNLSLYTAQLYLIESIDVNKFNKVYRPASNLIQLHSVYDNVTEYSLALRLFRKKLLIGEYIPMYDIKRDIRSITLKDWFIVKNTYVDPTEAISMFLEASKEFLEVYEYYSNLDTDDFNTKKNLINTKVIINNLFTLLEDLKHVS